VFRPELPHQLRHTPQLALRVIRIESLTQAVGGLLRFELQQHAVKQHELLAVHALDLFVQDGLELFRLHWRGGMAAFHVGTIQRRNGADKTAMNREPDAPAYRQRAADFIPHSAFPPACLAAGGRRWIPIAQKTVRQFFRWGGEAGSLGTAREWGLALRRKKHGMNPHAGREVVLLFVGGDEMLEPKFHHRHV